MIRLIGVLLEKSSGFAKYVFITYEADKKYCAYIAKISLKS